MTKNINAVVDFDYRHNYRAKSIVITCRDIETSRDIQLKYAGNIKISPGDILRVKAKKTKEKDVYDIVGYPIVEIPITKDNFIVVFDRWKRFVYKRLKCTTNAEKFYKKSMDIIDRYRKDGKNRPSSTIGDVFFKASKYPILELMQLLYKREDWDSHPYPPDMISTGQLNAFLVFWNKEVNLRRLYLFGITDSMIQESQYSPEELYDKLIENPFTVACIPMETAKDIFKTIDREVTTVEKRCGWALREIYDNLKRGNSYTPKKWLDQTHKLDRYLIPLAQDYDVLLENEGYYIKRVLYIEKEIARFFSCIALDEKYEFSPKGKYLETETQEIPEDLPVEFPENLSDDQMAGAEMVLSRKHTVGCITGKAGSGKTRLLRTIVHNLRKWNMSFGIFTFTGAASARANKVLGENISMTFHRSFKNENPDYDYVIVDEASMLCAELLYMFLSNNPSRDNKRRKYILVGDWNQLPPIGWGRVFQDIIYAEKFPVYVLTGCHRSCPFPGKPDGIVPNAESILTGDYCYVESENFYYSAGTRKDVLKYFSMLYKLKKSPEDVALICAFRKYGSVEYFNEKIRDIFRSSDKYIDDSDKKRWYIGDIVIATVNNYDINVMNGERGQITDVDDEDIEVTYKGVGADRIVKYTTIFESYMEKEAGFERTSKGKDVTTREINLGYAFTVHASQGSEYLYAAFFVDLDAKPSSFLNKNLAYTAVTRSKTTCKVIGPDNILENCSKQSLPYVRTGIQSRLKDLPKIDRTFQLDDDEPCDYDD